MALLAPYVGCHLLTSPPNPVISGDVRDVTIRDTKERETSSEYAGQHDREDTPPDTALESQNPAEPRFSEIENLLREP
jgi:hypothetical protein